MKVAIMTQPTYFVEEDKILTALFEEGLDNLHISKADSSPLYLQRLLSLIPKTYHRYIIVHQHYGLTKDYGLAGIHIDNYGEQNNYRGTIGRTCNNTMYLKDMKRISDYVFLKNVYGNNEDEAHTLSAIELKELQRQGLLGKHIYAMGGVTKDRISELKELGFGGVVIKDDIWKHFDQHHHIDFKEIIEYYKKLRQATY